MRILLLFTIVILFSWRSVAQTQVVSGIVIDEFSNAPLAFANVVVLKTDPVLGVTTDSSGRFQILNVPVGRYDIQVSMVGYQTYTAGEVVVSSAKEVVLTCLLREQTNRLTEVTVKPHINKGKALNTMATASARMLSVEEAQRYAGGFDDPARLASSFAGVASNVGSNGIVVRGNAPQYLQWKMEGVEVPNPNHFADLAAFGGGGLTALSMQMLANSDFFTGAFPAEYGNALSGVFDIFMRTGNNKEYEHTLQLGLIGIDASSEGPFRKGGQSSYLFNYRYSTLALAAPLLPENAGGVRYQDVSFKLNFPTRHAGVLSVWGIGLKDRSGASAKTDSTQWRYLSDEQEQTVNQYMAAAGVSHKYFINKTTYIKTTGAATVSGIDLATSHMNEDLRLLPQNKIQNSNWNFVLSSCINKKFNARHTNRSGVVLTGLMYDMLLNNAIAPGAAPQPVLDRSGFSTLIAAYTSSSISVTDKLVVNIGMSGQLFALNSHYTAEPRVGLKWALGAGQTLAFAYGSHSRLERLNYYFIPSQTVPGNLVNRNLDFTRAHHFVFGYDIDLSERLRLKAEAYFQWLYKVPVIADSSFSIINIGNDWFFDRPLVNQGKGRNYGLDVTLEKYLSEGYYYLVTASVFSAQYKGGDAIWRSTMYDRRFLFNFLVGKEWKVGGSRRNVFGANARIGYQGGDHYTPVNEQVSLSQKDVVYDYSNAFQSQLSPGFIAHFTISYKINRSKAAHEFGLKIINATMQKDFYGFQYNQINKTIDRNEQAVFIPNLSWKVSF